MVVLRDLLKPSVKENGAGTRGRFQRSSPHSSTVCGRPPELPLGIRSGLLCGRCHKPRPRRPKRAQVRRKRIITQVARKEKPRPKLSMPSIATTKTTTKTTTKPLTITVRNRTFLTKGEYRKSPEPLIFKAPGVLPR